MSNEIIEKVKFVSEDDFDPLIKRLNQVIDKVDEANGRTVKPKSNASEIDKVNVKLDSLRKNAEKGIESKVKVVLDPASLKKLNNLPSAKMKIDFLVDKGALSKSIGKDLKDVVQSAYTQMRRKTKNDFTSKSDINRFIKNIPELSNQARSSMITELKKKGIPESSYPSYEIGYRLRNYVYNAKKSMSSKGQFTTPSGLLVAPDVSLSVEEYGKAINGLIQYAQNIVSAASFFEKENEKFSKINPNFTIPVREDISSNKMKELTGFGIKVRDKNYKENNYANYLADQLTKKAGVYDIIYQAMSGTLDSSKLEISDIKKNIIVSLKTTKTATAVNSKLVKYVDTYINKSIEELAKEILNDSTIGKNKIGKRSKEKAIDDIIDDMMIDSITGNPISTQKTNKIIGVLAAYFAKGGSGIENQDIYKKLLEDLTNPDTKVRRDAIEQAVRKQLERTETNAGNPGKVTKTEKNGTIKRTTSKKQEATSIATSTEEKDATNTFSTASSAVITSKVVKPKSTTKETSTKKKSESIAKNVEQAQKLTNDELGALEGEFMRVYEEFSDAKDAYFSGNLSPFKYINKLVNYRTAYIKASNLIPGDSIQQITGEKPFSSRKYLGLNKLAINTSDQIFGIKNSLQNLGYNRKNYPEMFDILDNVGQKIISINNMRYNNRKNPNGDTDKIIQYIQQTRTLANKIESMVRENGYEDFSLRNTLPTSDKLPEEEKLEVISKPETLFKKKLIAKNERQKEEEIKTFDLSVLKESHQKNVQKIVDSEKNLARERQKEEIRIKKASEKRQEQLKQEMADRERYPRLLFEGLNSDFKISLSSIEKKNFLPVDDNKVFRTTLHKGTILKNLEIQNKEYENALQVFNNPTQTYDDLLNIIKTGSNTSKTLLCVMNRGITQNAIDRILSPDSDIYNMGNPYLYSNMLDLKLSNPKGFYDASSKIFPGFTIKDSDVKVTGSTVIASTDPNNSILNGSSYNPSDKYKISKKLYDKPTIPSELDGLEQIYQSESDSRITRAYRDRNKAILTLNQIRKKQKDESGNIIEGWQNSLSSKINFEGLSKDAINLTNKILKNEAALDTIRFKPTDKQNQHEIDLLKSNIATQKRNRNEIMKIAKEYASDPNNDYTYDIFVLNVAKATLEQRRVLKSTRRTNRDNFNTRKEAINVDLSKQISEVESIGQAGEIAAFKLKNIQQTLSRITTSAGLENVKKQIEDINEQFDSNKTREIALNYVNNIEKGLTGKQTVFIEQKDFNWYENSIKDDKWVGELATFERNRTDTLSNLNEYIAKAKMLGEVGEEAVSLFIGLRTQLDNVNTKSELGKIREEITSVQKQLKASKAQADQEAAISKQYEDQLNKNEKFTSSKINTTSQLEGYIAEAKKMGSVGEEAAKSFEQLHSRIQECYTDSGLNQIQNQMKETYTALKASKAQADQEAAELKNSKIAKTYDNIINKAKEVKSLNSELLGYKKQQTQYSEDSQTYKSIGDRIIETAAAAKKANSEFEELSKDNFVFNNSDQLKVVGKNVEDYEKIVREMKQSQDNVSGFDEKTSQAKNIKVFSEQYTDAIAKVKELKTVIQDLYSFQEKGSKGQITADEFIKGVSDRVRNISKLQSQVNKFRNEAYSQNSNNKDGILNNILFENYEETFSDYENEVSSYNDNIANLMIKAYSHQRKLSNDLYKMVGKKNYSEQEYNDKWNQVNTVQATYEALKTQVLNTSSNTEEIQKLFSGVKNSANLDRDNILGGLQTSLEQQINDFENSLKYMQNTTDLPNSIAILRDRLKEAFTFEDGADNIGNFKNRMQEFYQSFDALKGNSFIRFANEFGTAYDKLTKAENSSNKVSAYTDKLNGFVESYNNIISSFHDGKIDTDQAQKEISDLVIKIQDFQKIAKDYDKTNSKGTYVEASKGQIQDTKDVQTMLAEYAKSIGLTSQLSSNINETTGQVKMQFSDISGNVVTLTGNLEKAGNAMRVIASTASKASPGIASFGNSIKGMFVGNFKGALSDIASYVSYFQVTMRAIQQIKQGFNTFLDYEKDLTSISYTMNMSSDQLHNLGSSAIDMAKDLSISLNNTMDVYKIYANMNTTASEIQETARPTAILSNLSGVDASTAADQVQGILQQFHMLEDGSTTAADASMHIVDVLDKVSGSVGIDYAKGIKIMSDAIQTSGQVAYDAGVSYEQLAAITAKVSERTREDGGSIGNALKTIITRITKVGKMPQYADEVDNATLSNASASLHAVGVEVYNPDGSDRGLITVLSELESKWDDLSDAQQAKIAFDIAATRQTSKFKSILDAFTESMSLAEEATAANGNAEANQEKYMESTAGKLQAIKTQMQDFWVNFYNSDTVNGALDFVYSLTEGFTALEKTLGPIPALLTAVFTAMTVKNATMAGLKFLSAGGLTKVVG